MPTTPDPFELGTWVSHRDSKEAHAVLFAQASEHRIAVHTVCGSLSGSFGWSVADRGARCARCRSGLPVEKPSTPS